MSGPWNMARVASRRPLPRVRKMHGPVGDAALNRLRNQPSLTPSGMRRGTVGASLAGGGEAMACQGCGHHKCSCERQASTKLIGYDPGLQGGDHAVMLTGSFADGTLRVAGPTPGQLLYEQRAQERGLFGVDWPDEPAEVRAKFEREAVQAQAFRRGIPVPSEETLADWATFVPTVVDPRVRPGEAFFIANDMAANWAELTPEKVREVANSLETNSLKTLVSETFDKIMREAELYRSQSEWRVP